LSNNIELKYKPSEKQLRAHHSKALYLLYGGAVGGGKSLAKGTSVLTLSGWKPIDSCTQEDSVWSLSTQGKCELKKVIRLVSVGMEPAFRVTTKTGNEIVCSSTHPLLTTNGWKKINEIQQGDFVACCRKTFEPNKPTEEEDWYVCMVGYLLGDGCLRGSSVRFTCFNPKQVADVRKILPNFLSLNEGQKGSFIVARIKGNRGNNNILKDRIIKEGLFDKLSYDKFIPERIKNLNLPQTAMLLNRLYATDGWVDIGKKTRRARIGFCSVSKRLVLDVKQLLLRFGIVANLQRKKTTSTYGIAYTVDIGRWQDIISFKNLIGIVGKEDKLQEAFDLVKSSDKTRAHGYDVVPKETFRHLLDNMRSSKGTRSNNIKRNLRYMKQENASRFHLQEAVSKHSEFACLSDVAFSDIHWDQVKNITDLKTDVEMWDLEVEDNHNFIANGIFVHNSVFLVNDALWHCLKWHKNRVAIFRWENTTFMDTTYKTLKEWVLDIPGLVKHHNRKRQIITLQNDSEISYGGIKPSASVGGEDTLANLKSLEISRAYIDEITEVPIRYFNLLKIRIGRVWAVNGETSKTEKPPKAIRASANPEPGWVKAEWIDKTLPEHEFIKATIKDNQEHLGPNYESDLRRDLPSEWVDKYIEGDWENLSAFNAIFPNPWLLESVRDTIILPDPLDVAYGVDVAAEGDDNTVIVRRRGMASDIVLAMDMKNTMDTVASVAMEVDAEIDRIIAYLREKGIPEGSHKLEYVYWKSRIAVRIDSIGVGQGPFNRLEELGYNVIGIVGGAASRDPSKYKNLRAQMHWEFRDLLEDRIVKIPDDPDLLNELGMIKYMQNASERIIQVESKKQIKSRLGHSPDKADALLYAYIDATGSRAASFLF